MQNHIPIASKINVTDGKVYLVIISFDIQYAYLYILYQKTKFFRKYV